MRRVRIFSGIQPTGQKHLGNYIGAIRQYVEGQDRGESIYCIVDLHGTTMPYDPAELRRSTLDTTAILLAAGIDPARSILFRQSDVAEHTELTWLLNSVTAWGDLSRMHQWKQKRELLESQPGAFVSAGVFNYPILMAADVLVYRANEVPVGDDQRQHVELMRDVAERFNERFGETLVVPEHRIPEVGARIMDLQRPQDKMSTTGGSAQGTVLVLDGPEVVAKKIRSAVTDSGRGIHRGEGKEGIANLVEVLAAVRGTSMDEVESEFADSGYGDFKSAVADAVVEYLAPVRERYGELRPDESSLEAALAEGAEKARAIAAPIVADVRRAMGVGPPR
jgi:tryptophanyl-tRNA synthetase